MFANFSIKMESDELKSFTNKCRCCLQILEERQKLTIGEIVREKFFEMTQLELSSSTKLPQFICHNCFSILSRYSAMKKGFLENQNILNNLLKKYERLDVNNLYVKVEAIHEHKSSKLSESQDVYALKNPEELYHVEEFDDKQVKVEVNTIKAIFCDICNKIFNSQRTLKDHTRRIHLKIKKHHCDYCQYSCFSSYELKCHQNSNHRKYAVAEKEFYCDECNHKFSKYSCLVRHKKAHHMRITRFECDKCGHKTFKKENIIKHLNTHLPNTSKNLFQCSKCSAQLTSLYILKTHEKNFHKPSQKKFHCQHPNCDKSFARKISLEEHQKFVHLKIRPMSCDKCEKSFSSKSHLTRHQNRKHLNSNNLLVNNEIN